MIDDISIKLVEEFEELAFNRHGNFVLQYVLQHGSEEQLALQRARMSVQTS